MTIENRRAADIARAVLRAAYAAELLVLTLQTLVWPAGEREASVVIWLLAVLPLLIFLPGLLTDSLRNCVWLCFVSLGYFIAAVLAVMSPHGSWLHAVDVVLTILLFVSGMLFVRWRARALREIQEQ